MCKQSLKALLVAFVLTACLLNSTCRFFFSIACLRMSVGIIAVEFLVIGVYSKGVFSLETLLVPELLFRDSR